MVSIAVLTLTGQDKEEEDTKEEEELDQGVVSTVEEEVREEQQEEDSEDEVEGKENLGEIRTPKLVNNRVPTTNL